MKKAPSSAAGAADGHVRVAFNLSRIASPTLWSELAAVEQTGQRGAVGQRMTYLAALGLMYERQMGQTPTFSPTQVVDSQGASRVQVAQQTPLGDAGDTGSSKPAADEKPSEATASQVVDSTGDSRAQVAQWDKNEPNPANPGRNLAKSLVGRRNGFGRG